MPPASAPVDSPREGAGVGRALARLRDTEAIERAALALAVHPAFGGFERAWRLAWNGAAAALELRESFAAPDPAPPAGDWIETRGASRPATDPIARPTLLQPARLGAVAARAWGPALEPAGPHPALPWTAAAHVGAFALRRDGRPWALVIGTWSAPPDPSRVAALEEIARRCAEAERPLEAARRARAAERHAAALAEAVRVVGSARHVQEALQHLARIAAHGSGAAGAALWVAGGDGPRLEVTQGAAGRRERTAAALEPLARAAFADGRALTLDRAEADPRIGPAAARDVGSLALAPARDEAGARAVLACWDAAPAHPSDPPGFAAGDVALVGALADLAGVAVAEAARAAEARLAARERADLAARVQRLERLAWLGELAGRLGEEARPSLASIGAFARRAQRALAETDPARDYLAVVLRETGRLEGLLAEQAGYGPPDGDGLRLESLNGLVQEALAAASEPLVRRRVRITKKLAPDLPDLLLDGERVRRALANMLESALESVGLGGRVRVETRRLGATAVLELAHDGPRAPGEALEQLFVPFASRRVGGPTVGLGVAQQIVREHGGEIRVRSDGEWGSVLTLSLPVRENQDRRRAGDRRRARADRRARAAARRAG